MPSNTHGFGVPPTATRTTERATKTMSWHHDGNDDDDDDNDDDIKCLERLRSDYTLT